MIVQKVTIYNSKYRNVSYTSLTFINGLKDLVQFGKTKEENKEGSSKIFPSR